MSVSIVINVVFFVTLKNARLSRENRDDWDPYRWGRLQPALNQAPEIAPTYLSLTSEPGNTPPSSLPRKW